MIPGRGRPATPLQVAMFGHIAVALREAMAARDWKPGDLNVQLGRPRAHAGVYHYLAGKGAPAPKVRAKLAKALNIPEAELMPRKVGEAVPVAAIEGPASAPRAAPAVPVLQFAVSDDGTARIRLDVSLPTAQAVPLLRLLLDAGMIVGAPS